MTIKWSWQESMLTACSEVCTHTFRSKSVPLKLPSRQNNLQKEVLLRLGIWLWFLLRRIWMGHAWPHLLPGALRFQRQKWIPRYPCENRYFFLPPYTLGRRPEYKRRDTLFSGLVFWSRDRGPDRAMPEGSISNHDEEARRSRVDCARWCRVWIL